MLVHNFSRPDLSQIIYRELVQGISPTVTGCDFFARGGYALVNDFWHPDVHAALVAEAESRYTLATTNQVTSSNDEEARGGEPERKFMSASGGDVLQWIYHAPETRNALIDYTGLELTPTGAMGTFTYYCRTGDHLGLHRDVDGCDFAIITCLADSHRSRAQRGNRLWLYPQRWYEPLSSIKRYPNHRALNFNLAPGQTLLFLGGLIPHRIDACAPGQRRVVALLCFRAA